jgi:hypothetical protein
MLKLLKIANEFFTKNIMRNAHSCVALRRTQDLCIYLQRAYREGGKVALRGGGGERRVSEQGGQSGKKELQIGLIGNNHAVSGLGKSCGFRPIGKSWLVGLVIILFSSS